MTGGEIAVQQVRRHFSTHAADYDRYAVVQKRVVLQLLTALPPLDGIAGPAVDLGCGTGELAAAFARRHPQRPLLLIDLAHGMTCQAAANVPAALPLDADAAALPLRTASCGLLLSASMYQWVNDLPAAFAEAARVLRPGGLFACALFGAATLDELRQSHRQALDECRPGTPSHMQRFPEAAAVAAALAGAGLDGEVRCCREVEYHPDAATLLHHLKRIGAQNASRRRPAGLAERRVTLRMLEIYRERFGTERGVPAGYEVLSFVGRKA